MRRVPCRGTTATAVSSDLQPGIHLKVSTSQIVYSVSIRDSVTFSVDHMILSPRSVSLPRIYQASHLQHPLHNDLLGDSRDLSVDALQSSDGRPGTCLLTCWLPM